MCNALNLWMSTLDSTALAQVTRWEATFLQTQNDYIYSYLKGLQIFAV